MTFDVETGDLDAYSRQVGRAAEDVQSIKDYTSKYGNGLQESAVEQGLILVALELHEGAMTEGGKALSRVNGLLRSSSKELSKSSTYYRETDRSEAARFDSTYPSSKRGAPPESGEQGFSDVADAGSQLKAPATPQEFSHGPFSEAVGTLSSQCR